MKIQSIHIRRFRSVENASISKCGNLNILIGKNNSGKSNILSTIELTLDHLSRGEIAGPWLLKRPGDDSAPRRNSDEYTGRQASKRAIDDFTNRQTDRVIQIGIEFDLTAELNTSLRDHLLSEAPHRERLIEQIKPYSTIAFIISGNYSKTPFLFIEQIAAGKIIENSEYLSVEGTQLLSVPTSVASELFAIYQEGLGLRVDLRALDQIISSRSRLESMFGREGRLDAYYLESFNVQPSLSRQLRGIALSSGSIDMFISNINNLIAEIREKSEKLDQKQTEGVIAAFSGDTRSTPEYVKWLAKEYGSIPFLHLTEIRRRIGREEADALLRLKVKRGG
ncbi:MAG TPA: AAA family ATPase, partial [Roseiflexaceae bacterium]|nr:AAA family ATPase [Roseiflexaceae bacterium]